MRMKPAHVLAAIVLSLALVLQDDFHNTYEGCDSGAACKLRRRE